MTDYKELSDMNEAEYEAYLNGYNFALISQKESITSYDHNMYMCFSQGYSDGKMVRVI